MAEAPVTAQIFVLAGPDLGRSFPLAERTVLGRSDECDVVLRDRSISRKHAALVRGPSGWVLEDLGSTNGIAKDGKRAQRIELADGDEFRLGDLPLRLRLAPVVATAPAQAIEFALGDAPTALRPASPAERPAAVPARTPQPASPAPEVEVEIEIEGPDSPAARSAARMPAPAPPPVPRAARRTGFFAADLEQQPFWLRTLVVLLLLAFCAALAYGAYRGVGLLRG